MTQAEVKVFEKDVLMFPVETETEIKVNETEIEVVEVKKQKLGIDINKRFARLRKSIRKRSASIL